MWPVPTCAQFLDFGDVATHGWADQLVTFANTNTLLPVAFEVCKDQAPYFHIQPSHGLIHAGQEQQVRVRAWADERAGVTVRACVRVCHGPRLRGCVCVHAHTCGHVGTPA